MSRDSIAEDRARTEYASDCCRSTFYRAKETQITKPMPGVTQYKYSVCNSCNKYCDQIIVKMWDADGVEILPGHILECPNVPFPDHAERYHAVMDGYEIRDLGNNNVHMYSCWCPYYVIGYYWENLDKLSEDDLEYYWDTTRADALTQQSLKQEEKG